MEGFLKPISSLEDYWLPNFPLVPEYNKGPLSLNVQMFIFVLTDARLHARKPI